MKRSAPHLSDPVLLDQLRRILARECSTTAEVLDHIGEVDVRKLYVPAGYPSMFTYCVDELHLAEDAAYKRIQAARAAVRFPSLFDAVAEGRLHLSAVCLLAPHLTEDTADELIVAATHKSKSQIEGLLAARFPRPDLPARVLALPTGPVPVSVGRLAPGQVQSDPGQNLPTAQERGEGELQLAPGQVGQGRVDDRSRVQPSAPQRFAVQFTMSQTAHDRLRYAQDLLGHQVPPGDIAQVFERALEVLIPQLEKRRFSATTRPSHRPGRRSEDPRSVPADVQRAVWQRDDGRCTFVSESGHRCEERKFVELDHIEAVARGGEATESNLRLLCRAHNEYEAERTFGAQFMRHKRISAVEKRASGKE